MKRVKITANELDQAEAWLKNIDYTIEDFPMLLASYAHDIKIEKFPALLNLSDEIGNLAEKIKGIKTYDYVTIDLSRYNDLRDFRCAAMEKLSQWSGIKLEKFHAYYDFDKMIKVITDKLNGVVIKPKEEVSEKTKKLLVIAAFVIGLIWGFAISTIKF